jgi:hypothetical protein
VSIPVPGASFVYSLLKDVWSWVSTRFRGRRLAPDVFRGWTVDKWYDPVSAVRAFGYQDEVQDFTEAERQRDYALLAPDYPEPTDEEKERNRQYDEARWMVDHYTDVICRALNTQLIRGELIARGFREPFTHGAPYLTISRHEWRVLEVKLPDRAEGAGIGYVGLTIGKPGTKRLFRRSK